MLKQTIQVWIKAQAMVSAVPSENRMASGQFVKRSMHISKYTQPLDGSRGEQLCALDQIGHLVW